VNYTRMKLMSQKHPDKKTVPNPRGTPDFGDAWTRR
jgi:hypothetical protein